MFQAFSKTSFQGETNRTDSSNSLDEQQIKENGGGWQSLLPLPDLSRKIEETLLAGYEVWRFFTIKIHLCILHA